MDQKTQKTEEEQTVEDKKLGVLKELAPFFQDALDPAGKLAKEKEKEEGSGPKPVETSAPVSGGQLNAAPTKQLEQMRSGAGQQALVLDALQKDVGMFAAGGLATRGGTDPVSGNPVPVGSTPEEVRDDIPAQVSEGEYVVPADVVRYFGVKFFEDLRREAKSEFSGMESEGRIGGMNPMDDDIDPEDPYELAAKINAEGDEPVKMFLGGLFGKKDTATTSGGTTTQADFDKVTTGGPFVGNDWSVVGGSVFGQTDGVTYATYTNGSDTVSIPFFRGRNLRPIPHGYWLVGSGQGSGRGGGRDVGPDHRDARYTHGGVLPRSITGAPSASQRAPNVNLYAMSDQELLDWAKGSGGLFSNGLVGQLTAISRTRAAMRVAADRGLDVGLFKTLEQELENRLGIGADLMDELVASGEMRYNQQQVYNPKSEQYIDPATGQRPNATGASGAGGQPVSTPSSTAPTTQSGLGGRPINEANQTKNPANTDSAGNVMWEEAPAVSVNDVSYGGLSQTSADMITGGFAAGDPNASHVIVLSGFREANGTSNHAHGAGDVIYVRQDGTTVGERDPAGNLIRPEDNDVIEQIFTQSAARGANNFGWGNNYMDHEWIRATYADRPDVMKVLDEAEARGARVYAAHVGPRNTDIDGAGAVRTWPHHGRKSTTGLGLDIDTSRIVAAYRDPASYVVEPNRRVRVEEPPLTRSQLERELEMIERERQRLAQEEYDAVNRGDLAAAVRAKEAREELEAVNGIGVSAKSTTPDLPLGMGGEKVITDIDAMPKFAPDSAYQAGGNPMTNYSEHERAGYVVDGLVKRGLPLHVAQGFAMNFMDESDVNPSINAWGAEDSFGIAQWNRDAKITLDTGEQVSRLQALEDYARETGKPLESIDTQLDFITEFEMKRSPGIKAVVDAAAAAPNAQQAAVTILEKYENPAQVHQNKRRAAYLGAQSLPQPLVIDSTTPATPALPQQTGQQVTGFVGPMGGVPLVTVGKTGPIMQRQTVDSLFADAAKNPNGLFAQADNDYQIGHIGLPKTETGPEYYEESRQTDHPANERYPSDWSEGLRLVSPVPVHNSEGVLITTEVSPGRNVFHDYLRDNEGTIITHMTPDKALYIAQQTGLGIMDESEFKTMEGKANFGVVEPQNWQTGTSANTTASVNELLNRFGLAQPLIAIKEQLGIKPVPATATPVYGDTGVAQAFTDKPWMSWQTDGSGVGEVFSSKEAERANERSGFDSTNAFDRALAGDDYISGGSGNDKLASQPYDSGANESSFLDSGYQFTSPSGDKQYYVNADVTGGAYQPVNTVDTQTPGGTGGYGNSSGKDYYGGNDPDDDEPRTANGIGGGYAMSKGGLVARRKPKKRKK